MFGRDRLTIDDAVPGDIVGIVNATGVLVGDTLYADEPVTFPPIPTFAPERFVRVHNLDTNCYKRFWTGLVQLFESAFTLARLLEKSRPALLVSVGIDAADPLAAVSG